MLGNLVDNMPASHLVMHISKESFDKKTYDYSIGLTLNEDLPTSECSSSGVDHNQERLELCPSICLAFHTNITHVREQEFAYDNDGFLARAFEDEGIREYLREKGLRLSGDILGLGIHHVRVQNYTAFAWKFYLPIFGDPDIM